MYVFIEFCQFLVYNIRILLIGGIIMNRKKRKVYQQSWFRNLILIGFPTIISTIGVIISLIPSLSATFRNTLIVVIIFSMIVHICFVLFFASQEDRIYHEVENLEAENKKLATILAHIENSLITSRFTITTISELTEKWAKNINSFSNTVLTKQKVSDKSWDKIKYFDSICLQCKNMIKKYCNNEDSTKISVGFISCKEKETGEKYVHMISHSNPESTRPKACKNEEKLSESLYHYAELIKEEHTDIEVAINNEEVRRIFKNTSRTTDLSKYTQYIAIPVYCTSNKLLGIFQIVTKYDYVIEKEKVELLKFAEEYIIPYSNLIVLTDKINKGLYINPGEIERE